MKRITVAILCFIILLGGCAAKAPDAFDKNYVGEGQMTVLRYLINSNAFIVEDIFVESHLPTESGKDITNEKGTFAPVAPGSVNSYAELKETLESTYTKEAADKILNESDRYIEIDGKLYFNTEYAATQAEDYDWSEPEIKIISVADGTYEFELTIKKSNGFKHKLTVKAVTVDGNIRLDKMYY